MKTIICLALSACLLTCGCSTITGKLTPPVVQQGVATGVSYSTAKYPTAIPYVRAAGEVICSAANGTNLSPAAVVAAVESSNATFLKTPEGVLILNSALTLYIGVWESYGAEAVNNAPVLKTYLQATCDGINQGLVGRTREVRGVWPIIKF